MRDRIAILAGMLILILGLSVYLAPMKYELIVRFLPMSLVGIVVLALGTVLLIIGFASAVVERL